MKHWTELDLSTIEYSLSKTRGKHTMEYINIESAFDIETTSTEVSGDRAAFMYIWMMGIGHGENVYYGRTWSEFVTFLEQVVDFFQLGKKRRLVVYSHGLSYEFQFMRRYLEWTSGFNLDERKPLKAVTKHGIEFRDSYILTGYSLEQTAHNLLNDGLNKQIGSLDYTKVRHHSTPLTDEEMNYCKLDIQILTSYIKDQIAEHGTITAVPLTNTGRVRQFVRDRVFYTHDNHQKSSGRKYKNYRRLMDDLTLVPKEYYLLKKAFQGGFVHSNATWTGEVMSDVTGIDLTSAYPAVMLSEQFPMGKGVEVTVGSLKDLKELMKRFSVLFSIRLTGVKSKIKQENYISESKCDVIENPVLNNGRVYSADVLETTITDVDYQIIEQAYTWKTIQVADVIRYPRGYLPKDFIDAILDLYVDKTELKGVVGKESQYTHSKGMLNSTFGMTVTDIVRSTVEYKDGWIRQLPLVKEQLNGYNASKSRFLYYPWGVWITAYARKNLWSAILNFGDDYLYSDTDGIKLINYEQHETYVDKYNELNKRKLERMCATYRINPERLSPKTKEGVPILLGAWDLDGNYKKFKSLGAKRYMVQEGEDIQLTVAGVGKRSAKDYLLEQSGGNLDKAFSMFNDELVIPKDHSGNLTHTYIDTEMEFEVRDYLGNLEVVNTKSGVHLEQVDFSLGVTDTYIDFIEMIRDGYIFEGVDTFNV